MTALSIIASILSIVALILERRYSEEAIKKREAIERDEEIIKQDYAAISKRLSERLDAARLRNESRSNTGQ